MEDPLQVPLICQCLFNHLTRAFWKCSSNWKIWKRQFFPYSCGGIELFESDCVTTHMWSSLPQPQIQNGRRLLRKTFDVFWEFLKLVGNCCFSCFTNSCNLNRRRKKHKCIGVSGIYPDGLNYGPAHYWCLNLFFSFFSFCKSCAAIVPLNPLEVPHFVIKHLWINLQVYALRDTNSFPGNEVGPDKVIE